MINNIFLPPNQTWKMEPFTGKKEAQMNKKFLLIVTHAHDDPDRANIAWAMAASLVNEEADLAMAFMLEGVLFTKKGVAETIAGRNITPVRELLPVIREAKVPLFACVPCMKTRGVAEEDLIAGVKPITAPTLAAEMMQRQVITL